MSVVYAGPGMRHTPGDYTHLLTFAYGAALHSYRDAFANKEGSRQRVPFGAMLAPCTGENQCFAQARYRPGS